MMPEMLNEVISICREAAKTILGYYESAYSIAEKSPDNPVTDADKAADTLLFQRLTGLFPEAGWLSEETADNPNRLDKRYLWVVDPLDGTKEFVLGIPEFAVSVALVEAGRPVLAAVLNPATEELYHAQRGTGAYLNGRPTGVSKQVEGYMAHVDASRSERQRGEFESFENQFVLTTMGSIAYKLARVASGAADATWSRGPKHEWDICAGVLLVEEAGGHCVDLDNRPPTFNRPTPKVNGIIATNQLIHDQILTILGPHRSTSRFD